MSTVYGPVPSWRFGRSLGIDVVLAPKKCTFNCVYCQLGKTEMHISGPDDLDEDLVKASDVIRDLDEVMERLDMSTIDVVTFSGTGEPTLNLSLGGIASEVKKKIGDRPLIILTNSSLLHRKDIRKNLASFDLIVAKLDAGDDRTLQLINRPADDSMSIETILNSIEQLRREVTGAVALEVMLLRSEDRKVTNVEDAPLRNLTHVIIHLKPDQVQLEAPYRPPSEGFVKQPSQQKMTSIFRQLSEVLGEDRLLVYGLHDKKGRNVKWLSNRARNRRIVELLKRRPCSAKDISALFGIELSATKRMLNEMTRKEILAIRKSDGERYYSYKRTPRSDG